MEKPIIEFFTDNWAIRKHAPVILAKDFKPIEWREIPLENNGLPTIRGCPAVSDWLNQGFIIPAWCDMKIDPSTSPISIVYSDPSFRNDMKHKKDQLGSLLDSRNAHSHVLKLDNPWRIRTKADWSVQFLPLWYWNLQPWEAMPGIIDTDILHSICPINMIVKKLDPFVVKLGEPLVQVVPFQRQSVLGVTRPTNEKDLIRTNNLMKQLKLKFFGTKIFFHKPKKFRIEHINERENYIAPTFIEREEREHFF